MAIVKKPRYGIHVFYEPGKGKDRKTWFSTPEAQDRAYRREKSKAGKGVVRYVKKVDR